MSYAMEFGMENQNAGFGVGDSPTAGRDSPKSKAEKQSNSTPLLSHNKRLVFLAIALGSFIVAGSMLLLRLRSQSTAPTDDVEVEFAAFSQKYGRVYSSDTQRVVRLAIFTANYNYIQSENGNGEGHILAVNAFADLTPEEFKASWLGLHVEVGTKQWGLPSLGSSLPNGTSNGPVADAVDWVQRGAVTSVKNQLSCGSCWSFSSTGALEGAWAIATGSLESLSQQQLIDCNQANNACGGGTMDPAFRYAEDRAFCTESSYAYEAMSTQCRENTCTTGIPRGGVVGYKDVPVFNADALKLALMQQPVSVGINAGNQLITFYKSGIVQKPCSANLDHAVLAVGYGSEDGIGYWKIKNSWSPAWGELGYFRLVRNSSQVGDAGQCGILSMPSYPVVNGKLAVPKTVVA